MLYVYGLLFVNFWFLIFCAYFRRFRVVMNVDIANNNNNNKTPPSSPSYKENDVFISPTSSISQESGIDLKCSGKFRQTLPKFSLTGSTDTTDSDPNYGNAARRSSACARFDKTTWETLYAIQGKKLVKPTLRGTVYNFLERPRGLKSFLYHCTVLLAILSCLIYSVLTSVVDYGKKYAEVLFYLEIILVIFFIVEFIARLWSAGCRSKYMGLYGRARFISKPISIIDLIIITSSLVVLISGSNSQIFAASAIRGVRFLQILRLLHIDRQGGTWRLLGSVMYMHRQELITSLYIGFLGLIFSSYFMFLVEKDSIVDGKPSDFETYADALWWGVVTMMTIGYGDKVPKTWAGRALACVSAMFTVSFFALPAGILGSGFALKVQQQQRQKHFSRQIPAAATLIQCLWRCYASDKKFNSSATWAMYLKNDASSSGSKFKSLGPLRLRRPKSSKWTDTGKNQGYAQTNGRPKSPQDRFSCEEIAVELEIPRQGLHLSKSVPDMMIVMQEDTTFFSKDQEKRSSGVFRSPSENVSESISEENECDIHSVCRVTMLTETHKNAIRAIRKIKYFVAKRKFQQARKPYDVGDVIEQYSQGQLSMMVRIKELQRRLDQILGKPGAYIGERTGKPVTVGTQLAHLNKQLQRLDNKLDYVMSILPTLVPDKMNSSRNNRPIGNQVIPEGN